jgi:hypothetical protein
VSEQCVLLSDDQCLGAALARGSRGGRGGSIGLAASRHAGPDRPPLEQLMAQEEVGGAPAHSRCTRRLLLLKKSRLKRRKTAVERPQACRRLENKV